MRNSKSPDYFRIGSVEIENGSAVFDDTSLEPEIKLTLADLFVRADGISSNGATPIPATAKSSHSGGFV
jgi:hypothetical protein